MGQDSGAVAVVAEISTDNKITYITQNETAFNEGEVVTFEESTVQGLITTLDNTSRNISANYTFTNGQKAHFMIMDLLLENQMRNHLRNN